MALRTPDQFRQSLRDGCIVSYKGKHVEDVTTHPVLKIGVDSSAVDYELAKNPDLAGSGILLAFARGEHTSSHCPIVSAISVPGR